MEEVRQKIFIEYIDYLCNNGCDYSAVGKSIESVRLFLDSDYPITRNGYRKYYAAHSVDFRNKLYVKNSLCSFLAWKGVGFRKKKIVPKRERRTLEKIDTMCEKNKKILYDFSNYLSTNTDLSPSTISSYTTSVKLFFQYSTDFTTEMCRAYIATIENMGAAPRTINLKINALAKLSEFLKKPVALKRVKIRRTLYTDNIPNEEEYNRLLGYLKNKNMNRYFDIKILATTGARVSEYLQITWEDILRGEVTLKGKGSKYRHFFFSKSLIQEAKQYVEKTGATGVVCKSRSGTPMTSRGLSENMKEWGKRIGIDKEKMHPHAFRHFFAKMYLKKNKDVVQLAELLGHSSIDTTKIYLQKSFEEQRRDFNKNVNW